MKCCWYLGMTVFIPALIYIQNFQHWQSMARLCFAFQHKGLLLLRGQPLTKQSIDSVLWAYIVYRTKDAVGTLADKTGSLIFGFWFSHCQSSLPELSYLIPQTGQLKSRPGLRSHHQPTVENELKMSGFRLGPSLKQHKVTEHFKQHDIKQRFIHFATLNKILIDTWFCV